MKPLRDHQPTDSETVRAMASAWLAQRDEGLTSDEARAFAQWRASDPRHEAAVHELEQVWSSLQRLRALQPKAAIRPDPDALAPQRRGGIFAYPKFAYVSALAAAAVVILAVVLNRPAPTTPSGGEMFTSAPGEYRQVKLPDGSVVDLNGGTEMTVAFSGSERRVKLLRGEGHFTVAKNPDRPFVVETESLGVRAVGTAFGVRLSGASVQVLVTEGRVRIDDFRTRKIHQDDATAANESAAQTLLDAGTRMIVTFDRTALPATIEKVDPETIRRELAWQGELLRFVDTPLGDVIAQLNQRNRVQISLRDPELAALPFGGSFRADNVDAFVRLLGSDQEIAVERPDTDRIVLRRRK